MSKIVWSCCQELLCGVVLPTIEPHGACLALDNSSKFAMANWMREFPIQSKRPKFSVKLDMLTEDHIAYTLMKRCSGEVLLCLAKGIFDCDSTIYCYWIVLSLLVGKLFVVTSLGCMHSFCSN